MIANQHEVIDLGHRVAVRTEPPGRERAPSGRQQSQPWRPGIRTIQVILGLTWILVGALQFQPFMFSKGFLDQVIAPVSQGQPSWVAAPITWSVHLMGHHLIAYNALFATVQVLIGAGLLFRRSVRPALVLSFGWALGVWWFGEGLGMILTGTASPLSGAPGAVILYAVVGVLVWPTDRQQHASPTVDRGAAPGWAAPLGRLVWAALWLLFAALWLMPANRGAGSTSHDVGAASYGWLKDAQHAVATAANGHGLAIAVGFAVASAVIALGVLVPPAARPALVAGAVVALAYWGFGQGFGMITTGSATDISTGPLVVLLALRLWGDPARVNWRALLPSRRRPLLIGRRPHLVEPAVPFAPAPALRTRQWS